MMAYLTIHRRGVLKGVGLLGAGALAAVAAEEALSGVPSPLRLGGAPGGDTAAVEPNAGTWKTWLLSSGSQLRVAPPPDVATTRTELQQLKALISQRDASTQQQIQFWDVGSPAFRWNEIAITEALQRNLDQNHAARAMALLNVAIYDATIAAWDSKYAYNRPRPSASDPTLVPAVPNSASPSYPSEHAATAGAAAAILAYIFPDHASSFLAQADAAAQSRVQAGLQYPSDAQAGLELGRQIGALAVERAKHDGSDAVWDGKIPTGPGYWTGKDPIQPTCGTWQPWVLSSGREFRPEPPPAYDSAPKAKDLAEIKSFARTPLTNNVAFYWQYVAAGYNGHQYWYEQTTQKISQYRLDANPPRAARAYALAMVTFYDAIVACWDGKYTYWAIRPFQLDSEVKTLFPTPNHPSYPAAHASLSTATATTLGYLFPSDAKHFVALAQQAGESRIWAGIHYRSDITAGAVLGNAVAQKVIARAQADRSG
jgi:membrane-associated phospholipid phosphatase